MPKPTKPVCSSPLAEVCASSEKTDEKTDKKTADINALPASYEAALEELETLLALMEARNLPMNDWVHTHQRSRFLIDFCHKQLEIVENQMGSSIRVLDGNGQLSPLCF
jgi:exodeoxyribonuclease VII small subunit